MYSKTCELVWFYRRESCWKQSYIQRSQRRYQRQAEENMVGKIAMLRFTSFTHLLHFQFNKKNCKKNYNKTEERFAIHWKDCNGKIETENHTKTFHHTLLDIQQKMIQAPLNQWNLPESSNSVSDNDFSLSMFIWNFMNWTEHTDEPWASSAYKASSHQCFFCIPCGKCNQNFLFF